MWNAMSSSITNNVRPVKEQKNKTRPKSPPNDSIYCVDIHPSKDTEWVRIESTYQETDLIILQYVNKVVDNSDTLSGDTIRYYTLDESNSFEQKKLNDAVLTPDEKKAVKIAKETVLAIHPEDARLSTAETTAPTDLKEKSHNPTG